MSDLNHILFSVISFVCVSVLLIIAYRFVKSRSVKDTVLKASAIITVVIHYSSLYVDFFTTGSAVVSAVMLLPIYPCNIAMWLLLIAAFIKNREGRAFKYIAEFTFYIGIVGGIIGILFNEIYIENPNLADWGVLKGLLSHVTMLFGAIYLLVGGYIRIRVDNMVAVLGGLCFMIIDGVLIIALYRAFGLTPPNTMFLLENPFPQLPWFNPIILGVFGALLVFAVTAAVEAVLLPKHERWYTVLQTKFEKKDSKIK